MTGPSVVNCFNAEGGMGVCLRGKMTDAGLLGPTAPAAITADTEAPATEEVAVVEPAADPAVGAPALDVTPPADVPDDLVAATFGLLRAEPDGSVVIAGSGTPGTEIEVYSDETLIGKTTVESSGDWVIVPDAPLPPGGTEITLAEAGQPGRADQSFVVVINDDKSSEPLVVASTPGAISEVLQGMASASEADTQVAAADPVTAPAAPAPANGEPAAAPVAAADAPAAPTEPAPAAEPAPAVNAALSEQTPPTTEPAPVVDAPEQPTSVEATEPAVPTETPAVPPVEQPAATPAEAAPPAAPDTTPAVPTPTELPAPAEAPAPAQQPETSVAAVDPAPAAAPSAGPVVPNVAPTIDAIEIEGDRAFFAGAGPDGATIRLYVDDAFIADATVQDGRWLVEADNVLTKDQQRVRIDMLAADSAAVAARAEVNFRVDLPAEAEPTAVAEAPATSVPAEPTTPAVPATETPEPAAEPATAAEPEPAAEPAPADEPAASTPAEAPVATAEVAPAEQPASETTAVEPTPEPEPVATAEATPTPTPAETPVADDVPTLVGVSFGSPDAQRFSAGKAIIRRGDNLWTIARRVYGEGIKYTAIYDANTGQIRDPDRIYPGQVFDLPN